MRCEKITYPFGDKMLKKLGLKRNKGIENNIDWKNIPKPGTIFFDDTNKNIIFNLEDFGIYFDFPGMALLFKYSDCRPRIKKAIDYTHM